VKDGKNKQSGHLLAIKIITKSKLLDETNAELKDEIILMQDSRFRLVASAA
jgi:hypothetical protein